MVQNDLYPFWDGDDNKAYMIRMQALSDVAKFLNYPCGASYNAAAGTLDLRLRLERALGIKDEKTV